MNSTNYIDAEIDIKEKDINKNIKIINSFENVKKEKNWKDDETDNIKGNQKEIKRCEIKINGESIPFCYRYNFNKSGKHNIQYSFSNELTNINYMFNECSSLTKIDLSNFNTQNVTDMHSMFSGCSSLTNIDLSNFNTQNVTNMNSMFCECNSLTNIDLSNFTKQNLNCMSFIFNGCNSLMKIIFKKINKKNKFIKF